MSKDDTKELEKLLKKQAGSVIRKLREQANLKQSDFLDVLGSPYINIISQYERGLVKLPSERWDAWSTKLNVDARMFAKSMLYHYDTSAYVAIFGAPTSGEIKALMFE